MTETSEDKTAYAEMASELVSAYVANNSVPMVELPNLIRSVHDALAGLGTPAAPEAAAEPLKPAVPIRKSITDEFIISLEDGRKLKSMKRYLSGLGMTPAEYRARWGLPHDYPMVAPAYAAQRSALAKTLGLGRKGVGSMPASKGAPEPDEVDDAPALTPAAAEEPVAKPKRARKPKAA